MDDDTTDESVGRADVVVQPGTNHYLVAAQIPRRVGSHWEAGTALYRSTDMGLTFQPGVHIDTARYDTRHPHIAADRDYIICDYFADRLTDPTIDTIIVEARTFYTQADSWGTPVPMTNLDSLYELYYSGPLALSGDGRVHTALTVQDTVDFIYNMYYTSSSDHGVSWSDIELVNDDTTSDCHWPDIGADSTGHAYIVWYKPSVQSGEIWFATNAPLGIAEEPMRQPIGVQPSATVVRSVLFLPSSLLSPPSSLLSIDGRKIRDLIPGANDVSALAPGVYFVRQASCVEREASRVTKVVVTR